MPLTTRHRNQNNQAYKPPAVWLLQSLPPYTLSGLDEPNAVPFSPIMRLTACVSTSTGCCATGPEATTPMACGQARWT